jgi:hypothetical protein
MINISSVNKIYYILLSLHLIFSLILSILQLYGLYFDDTGNLIRNLPSYLIALQNIAVIGMIFNMFVIFFTLLIGIGIFIATIITRKKIKIIWVLIQLIILTLINFSAWFIFLIGFD